MTTQTPTPEPAAETKEAKQKVDNQPAPAPASVPTPLPAQDDRSDGQWFEARSVLYSKSGTQINLTSHCHYGDDALDGLVAMVEMGIRVHGWTPVPAPAPAAQPAPQQQPQRPGPAAPAAGQRAAAPPPAQPAAAAAPPAAGVETLRISAVSVDYTKGGDMFLRCKGGRYTQHGIRAYMETIPLPVWESMPGWTPNVDYSPPAEIAVAVHDGKKVIEFRSA